MNFTTLNEINDMVICHAKLLQPTSGALHSLPLLKASPKVYRHVNATRHAFSVPETPHSRFTSSHRHDRTVSNKPRWLIARAGSPDIDISSLLDDLDLPEIDADLSSFQSEAGAVFDVRVLFTT